MPMRPEPPRRRFPRNAAIALLWLGIWAGAAALVGQQLLLPSPRAAAKALYALAAQGDFWLSCCRSLGRIFIGYALGILLGCGLAVLTFRYAWWRDFFTPLLSAVKAMPVASFILLALVWMRTNGVPMFATVVIVLPMTWTNISEGIAATDAGLLEMARAFCMPSRSIWRHVYWPSVQPAFRAVVTAGMGMAWKAGVAAEIICQPRESLGSVLYRAKIHLDTPALFASTAVVIVLSMALEKLMIRFAYRREWGRRDV